MYDTCLHTQRFGRPAHNQQLKEAKPKLVFSLFISCVGFEGNARDSMSHLAAAQLRSVTNTNRTRSRNQLNAIVAQRPDSIGGKRSATASAAIELYFLKLRVYDAHFKALLAH